MRNYLYSYRDAEREDLGAAITFGALGMIFGFIGCILGALALILK